MQTSRRYARAALICAAALLALLLVCLPHVSAVVIERLKDPLTGEETHRKYHTLEEVEQAAEARGMTAVEFVGLDNVEESFGTFTCADGSNVSARCTSVSESGLCFTPRTWAVTDADGYTTILPGSQGIDVCKYSTCVGMECRNSTLPNVVQLMSASQPQGCICFTTDFCVAETAAGTSGSCGSNKYVFYSANSSTEPKNDTKHCRNYVCNDPSMQPARVVYNTTSRECYCLYPSDQVYPSEVFTYPATFQSAESSSSSVQEQTVNPVQPTDAVTTTTTLSPADDRMNALSLMPYLCPNRPSDLSLQVWTAMVDDFCCTSYPKPNVTWTGCGTTVFVDMPVSHAYCSSSIPSYAFCCEVERMARDTFVYRGDKCTVTG